MSMTDIFFNTETWTRLHEYLFISSQKQNIVLLIILMTEVAACCRGIRVSREEVHTSLRHSFWENSCFIPSPFWQNLAWDRNKLSSILRTPTHSWSQVIWCRSYGPAHHVQPSDATQMFLLNTPCCHQLHQRPCCPPASSSRETSAKMLFGCIGSFTVPSSGASLPQT